MKWTTRDGDKIELHEMTESHIANCIKYLDKKRPDEWNIVGDLEGCEFTRSLIRDKNEEIDKVIKIFEKELRRRELAEIKVCTTCGKVDIRQPHICDLNKLRDYVNDWQYS